MSDQPPDVVDHDNDRPTNHETATDRRPTDHTPLSLEDAADQLGISVNAVRQRIKRGTLHGEKTSAGWVVFLSTDQVIETDAGRRPTDQPTSTSRPGTNRPTDQDAIAPLVDLVADLSRQNQELAAAAALWQYRAMRAEERVEVLEAGPITPLDADDVHEHAPQDVISAPQRGDADETTNVPLQSGQDAKASAWRRWWRRMTGGAVDLS